MAGFRSLILGIGSASSLFTEYLVRELVHGPSGHGLVAVGVYDKGPGGPKVRRRIKRMTGRRTGVSDISVNMDPTKIATPERELLYDLKRAAWGQAAQMIILIIDDEYAAQYLEIFRDLRNESPAAQMVAICFTDEANEHRGAYDALETLTQPDEQHNNVRVLEAAFMISKRSQLARRVGDIKQSKLLAKSIAGIWQAPLFSNYPQFMDQVSAVRQEGKPFIGMALRTEGMTRRLDAWYKRLLFYASYPISRFTTWFIPADDAAVYVVAAVLSALNHIAIKSETTPPQSGVSAMNITWITKGASVETTTIKKFDPAAIHTEPISVNVILPFRYGSEKFNIVADAVQTALGAEWKLQTPSAQVMPVQAGQYPSLPAQIPGPQPTPMDGYSVNVYSKISGKGVNLTTNAALRAVLNVTKANYYCQVCVLFPAGKDDIVSASALPAHTGVQVQQTW